MLMRAFNLIDHCTSSHSISLLHIKNPNAEQRQISIIIVGYWLLIPHSMLNTLTSVWSVIFPFGIFL